MEAVTTGLILKNSKGQAEKQNMKEITINYARMIYQSKQMINLSKKRVGSVGDFPHVVCCREGT